MKVYKLEVMIIDFDGVGEEIQEILENQKFPNRCISPNVMSIKSVDIGKWDDDHPLNTGKQKEEFERLFK